MLFYLSTDSLYKAIEYSTTNGKNGAVECIILVPKHNTHSNINSSSTNKIYLIPCINLKTKHICIV